MTTIGEEFRVPEPGLGARLYAALHCGNAGDVEFYLRACRSRKRQRVLEFGSGALRLGLALARAGHEVTGVELDPALHELAVQRLRDARSREKLGPVHLVLQNMVDFRTPQPFDKCLMPYSVFWCLPSIENKRACLSVAHAALKSEGELILDVYSADHLRDESEPLGTPEAEPIVDEFELTEHLALLADGQRYKVYERNQWWPSRQLTCVEYGVERVDDPTERWRMTLDHHYLWRHELARLLDEAGFETEWGADDRAYGTPFDQQIVVRATKR